MCRRGTWGWGGRLFLSCSGFVAVITTLDKGSEGAALCHLNTCLKLNKIINFTGSKGGTSLQRALAILIISFDAVGKVIWKPTRCNNNSFIDLQDRLNMFRANFCPSSGAQD